MSILSLQTVYAGVASHPHRCSLLCNDDYATLTAAGYINKNAAGAILDTGDFIFANYDTNSQSAVMLIADIDSNGIITLNPPVVSPGIITDADVAANAGIEFSKLAALPNSRIIVGNVSNVPTSVPMSGDVAISNAGITTISDGAVTPSKVGSGVPTITVPVVSGNLAATSGTAGLLIDSGIAANKVLVSNITNPDTPADLVSFDVVVGQAALASGGSVILITSSGSKQYKIRSLQLNSGGTNFSGGGGDRLGQVTDGTTVYSVIPAATLQTLVNAQWGVTALANPASAAINTSTVAGANLVFKYSGGTADYTAGSLTITGIAERVA